MGFAAGDRIIFVNDTGRGKVLRVLGDGTLLVEDENGFEYQVKAGEVMKEMGNLGKVLDRIDEYDVRVAMGKEAAPKSRLQQQAEESPTYIKYSPDTMEVDLHIENLVDHPKKLTNGEIVELQLKVFERMLEKAISERKRRVIFIHGVGQGVLRSEIRELLKFYPNVVVHDASYKQYGYGATEVLIRQNA